MRNLIKGIVFIFNQGIVSDQEMHGEGIRLHFILVGIEMGSGIHEDGVGLFVKKHVAKFMGAYKKLFMLWKIFSNINDVVSLKILVKAADTYQWGKNKDHI